MMDCNSFLLVRVGLSLQHFAYLHSVWPSLVSIQSVTAERRRKKEAKVGGEGESSGRKRVFKWSSSPCLCSLHFPLCLRPILYCAGFSWRQSQPEDWLFSQESFDSQSTTFPEAWVFRPALLTGLNRFYRHFVKCIFEFLAALLIAELWILWDNGYVRQSSRVLCECS